MDNQFETLLTVDIFTSVFSALIIIMVFATVIKFSKVLSEIGDEKEK